MTNSVLIHYGELGLKGKNLRDFENRLRKNIQAKISKIDSTTKTELHHKYLVLTHENIEQKDKVGDQLSKVFGIKWFANVRTLDRNLDYSEIVKEVIKIASSTKDSDTTFRITCKRADKRYPMKSGEIEQEIGHSVIEQTKLKKVNLNSPEIEIFVEINNDFIFIFSDKQKGAGGLPVGSGGRVLCLLSGGFDSPVAAYLIAKRGFHVDYLHFYVQPINEESKICKIVKALNSYTSDHTNRNRIYASPYLPFNMEILQIETRYELVLFRRFVLKYAEKLIEKYHYKAIVSGDNIGQVASQTIENIIASEDALAQSICFRPLLSFDKEEILQISKRIKLFDICKISHKDCCSLIDKHAKTKVTIERIRYEESKLKNYDGIIKNTEKEQQIIEIDQ
ncbi:tRNA 4-thiouridine(8) synthase ThiI [Candidatus Dojkabacteria bacterium]|nr:tRNA 4-thiouridine(8) synthase ThiI [Candidatus Dojkabacteria bacterium]